MKKRDCFFAFIDLKRAIECVYLNEIWFKRYDNGINAKMPRIIKDMYSK